MAMMRLINSILITKNSFFLVFSSDDANPTQKKVRNNPMFVKEQSTMYIVTCCFSSVGNKSKFLFNPSAPSTKCSFASSAWEMRNCKNGSQLKAQMRVSSPGFNSYFKLTWQQGFYPAL